jgi:hypothetical protein
MLAVEKLFIQIAKKVWSIPERSDKIASVQKTSWFTRCFGRESGFQDVFDF